MSLAEKMPSKSGIKAAGGHLPVRVNGKGYQWQELKEWGPDEQGTPLLRWGNVSDTCGCSNDDERI